MTKTFPRRSTNNDAGRFIELYSLFIACEYAPTCPITIRSPTRISRSLLGANVPSALTVKTSPDSHRYPAITQGQVLWCVARPDLFAPAIAQAGLLPDRVIYVDAGDEQSVLVSFEEGLRHGALGAVVAEVARLSMTASRRLHLAAEGSGVIGIAIRRWRRHMAAVDFGQPTAAVTRWRVSALPSTPLPVPGVGRARWQLELIRCRAGESTRFEVEACDAKGRLAFPSNLVHGSAPKEIRRRHAAS
jgi:protein ImuA